LFSDRLLISVDLALFLPPHLFALFFNFVVLVC